MSRTGNVRSRHRRDGEPAVAARSQRVPPLVDSFPFRVVAQRHRPRDAAMRRYLAVADLVTLICVQSAVMLSIPRLSDWQHVAWAVGLLPVWLIVFKAYGLYDRDIKRISHTTLDDVPWIFHGVIVGTLIMFLWFRFMPVRPVHGQDLLPMAAITMVALVGARAVARRVARRIQGAERVLLIGERRHVDLIARKMRAHPEYRLAPVGVLGADPAHGANGTPLLGPFVPERFAAILTEKAIDRVVVSHVDVGEEALLNVVRRCRELSIKVSLLPQLSDAMGPSVEVDDVEGVTVLGITPPVLPRSSRTLKRAMDVVGSAALLVVFSPVLLCTAVAIRLDSRGPVLFRQHRVGRRGRPFKVLKFRTMVVDAEAQREGLLSQSRDPHWLDLEDDPRITRVGRVLRHTSIDELPQLWNVLKGEMSLVGPRPIVPSEAETLAGWRLSRVDLTPGLTGLWQVLGRTNIPFEEMITLDYLYVTNWSLWTDVRLLIRTLPAVVAKKGVN